MKSKAQDIPYHLAVSKQGVKVNFAFEFIFNRNGAQKGLAVYYAVNILNIFR